jgi:hypothetical protein
MEQRGRTGTRKLVGVQVNVPSEPVVAHEDGLVTLESLKKVVLDIESRFTDSSIQFQREWEFKHVRDMVIKNIQESTTVEELAL